MQLFPVSANNPHAKVSDRFRISWQRLHEFSGTPPLRYERRAEALRDAASRSQVFTKEEEDDPEALVDFRPSWRMILRRSRCVPGMFSPGLDAL